MSRHEDGFESRLPDDGKYWASLAERIDARAAPLLARRRPAALEPPVWWARAELSPALALGAVLCAVGAWWFVPSDATAADSTEIVARALHPADPLADRLLATASAPDLAALITNGATGAIAPVEE